MTPFLPRRYPFQPRRYWWVVGLFTAVALAGLARPRSAQACTRPIVPAEWLAWYEPVVALDQSALPAGLKITPLPVFNRQRGTIDPLGVSLQNEGRLPVEVTVAEHWMNPSSASASTFLLQDKRVSLWRNGEWLPQPQTEAISIRMAPPAVAPAPVVDQREGEGRLDALPLTQTLTLRLLYDSEPLAVPLQFGHKLNPTYDPAGYANLPGCGFGAARGPLLALAAGMVLAVLGVVAVVGVLAWRWLR